jgi:hypothetical protein
MQFVCEFALENAKNSVLELHKCKNFLGEDPQTPPQKKLQMLRYVPDGYMKSPVAYLR